MTSFSKCIVASTLVCTGCVLFPEDKDPPPIEDAGIDAADAETSDADAAPEDAPPPRDAARDAPSASDSGRPDDLPTEWLGWLNLHRKIAGVPDVVEDSALSDAALKAAQYIVRADRADHFQDEGSEHYTPEGDRIARNGVLFAYDRSATYEEVFDFWMSAPLHAAGLLDPRLGSTGFALYSEPGGLYSFGAAADVFTDLEPEPRAPYPILYPGDGSEQVITSHLTEYPDPLTACPGYIAPAGAPILVFLGNGSRTPVVSAHSLTREGDPVEHCIFDETTYVNSDPAQQRLARAVLGERDLIVMMPRHRLGRGATYDVSITVDGEELAWSFSVARWAR